jgi:hypothetical protein
VRLVRQWDDVVRRLPAGWVETQVTFHLRDPSQLDRAATLLGPLQAVRSSPGTISFRVATDGSGPSPASAERLLDRVGREKIAGTIQVESSAGAPPAPAAAPAAIPAGRLPEPSLAESWDAAVATLPADWSDLLGEVELDSSDYLERAALHLSPLNPRRDDDRLALRFRCARLSGYGASPGMVRRCLERCDDDRIVGRAQVLRVLSDTHTVQTQGPVWQIAGRTV